MSKKTIVWYEPRTIVNQDVSHLTDRQLELYKRTKLPTLLRMVRAVEDFTGHKWVVTSFIRNSPSHKDGSAIDIAPDISSEFKKLYSVDRMSDPILYKREPLLRDLQRIARQLSNDSAYDIGIFVEPDHLHIGLFIPKLHLKRTKLTPNVIRLYKWGITKPIYADTYQRSKLPLIS